MKNSEVVHLCVEANEGYGNGILNAIPLCTAPWIGIILRMDRWMQKMSYAFTKHW